MNKEEIIEYLRCLAWRFYKMDEDGGFYKDEAILFEIAQFIKEKSDDNN